MRKDAISNLFCKCDKFVKLERRKKLKHVNNDCCCVKKLPVDIKMLEESVNKTVSAKKGIRIADINDIRPR